MRPDVSHIGLAVDTGDGGSCRRPPLGGRTRLVFINVLFAYFDATIKLVKKLYFCVVIFLNW